MTRALRRIGLLTAVWGALAAPAAAQTGSKTAPTSTALPTVSAPSTTAAPAAGSPGAIQGYVRGAVRTLPVTGTPGPHRETIMAPGNGWVYGLEMGEKADQPCHLAIWSVEGSARPPSVPTTFSRCAGDVNNTSVKTLGFEYARTSNAWNALREYGPSMALGIPIYSEIRAIGGLLALSNAHPPAPFIDGVPVALDGVGICQRSSNDELKGLRAHGATLNTTGAAVATSPIATTAQEVVAGVTIPAGARRNAEVKRPNCNSWQAIRTCAANEVLVGLEVHFKRPFVGNPQRARITGLAPICATVTIQR